MGEMVDRLDQWVTQQAERRPDVGAVVLGEERLTYGQLEALSNRLARCLRESGCQKGDRVCLLSPKSPAAIAAIVGIYKADCTYVPLDPGGPASRLAKIIGSSEPSWIVAAGPVAGLLDELFLDDGVRTSIRVGWLGPGRPEGEQFRVKFSADDLDEYPEAPIDSKGASGDPAHLLFTSGSTGTPKGVIITHANVIHFVEWGVRYFELQQEDRISGHPPLYFDLSVFDIFGTFAAGGELHLVPPDINVLPNKLAEFIRRSALTQWFSVPSVLNYMAAFDAVRFHDFPTLRRLLWCGEVLPTTALIYWMKRLPHVRFTNLYGPTETTIASSYYTVPACPVVDTAQIPIGQPCDGEELIVFDEGLRATPPGEVGELYVGGEGVSPGYWRDPERTRTAFLSDPRPGNPAGRIYKTGDLARVGEDGLVYLLGRVDSQIKSRGYRIELGEIESALHALGCLREAAVVAITAEGFEGFSICCAYVPAQGQHPAPAGLRQELSRLLPAYMLPAQWLVLGELPKNTNGKIDRRWLKENFQCRAAQARTGRSLSRSGTTTNDPVVEDHGAIRHK
jgi:amino acid adenylation domain-containing protein